LGNTSTQNKESYSQQTKPKENERQTQPTNMWYTGDIRDKKTMHPEEHDCMWALQSISNKKHKTHVGLTKSFFLLHKVIREHNKL